jgi:hypothetical protein
MFSLLIFNASSKKSLKQSKPPLARARPTRSNQMLHSLSEIDNRTLERWRQSPDQFIEEVLVSPYTWQPYVLTESGRAFVRCAFERDADGRLLYPLQLCGAPKKSRKSELANLITITAIVLFGGRFAEGYIVSNSKDQAIDRCFTGCKRILEASPPLADEVICNRDQIYFLSTQSTITAVAQNPAAIAGGHPTISVFDEMHAAPSGERGRAMWDALVPTPTKKISFRLAISHAGVADDDHLLYQLYQRGVALPKIGKDLYAGSGMLCFWSHEPQHSWQDTRWLEQMKRDLPPAQYQFMIENRFVTAEAAYITPVMYARSEKQSAPPPSDPKLPLYVGVDAAPLRDTPRSLA